MSKVKRLSTKEIGTIAIMIQNEMAKLNNSNLSKQGKITWGQIRELVITKFEIKNWIDVRLSLKMLLTADIILRTSDLNVEEYVLLFKAA